MILDWQKTKEYLYFDDGSWRDIYVLETSKKDWQKWIDYCNTNYSLKFHNGRLNKTKDHVDINVVFDFWESKLILQVT